MTQKLILSVAMYSYLCIALLIMWEVAISDSLICVILNTNVAEIDCSISGTKSNKFLEWYENIVRLNNENYTMGIRCALSYHVWSLFFPLFNIIIMYFFVVVVVLECRPGYFRVFQEMYWTWYLHDSISQRAESVARSYEEHWNSQGWYRLE